jgi:hypothetical protein
LLRFVHCGIRRGNYRVCVFEFVGTYNGSHTGRHNSLASLQLIRFPKGHVEPICDNHCFLWGTYVVKKNQEFIPSHTGRAVTRPQCVSNTFCRIDEQSISNAMAQSVVNPFEIVEVDKDDRITRMTAIGQTHSMGKTVPEQRTAWKAGKFVMERSARQFVGNDLKFSSSVRDLALDLSVGSFKLFAKEVDTRSDGVNRISKGADRRTSIESKKCELLDRAHYLFQAPFNVMPSRVVPAWLGSRVGRVRCITSSQRRSVFRFWRRCHVMNSLSQARAEGSSLNSFVGAIGLLTAMKKFPIIRLSGVAPTRCAGQNRFSARP